MLVLRAASGAFRWAARRAAAIREYQAQYEKRQRQESLMRRMVYKVEPLPAPAYCRVCRVPLHTPQAEYAHFKNRHYAAAAE